MTVTSTGYEAAANKLKKAATQMRILLLAGLALTMLAVACEPNQHGWWVAQEQAIPDHEVERFCRANLTTCENTHERIGAAITTAKTTPQPTGFKSVSAGDGHSCALRSDNTITCWSNGQSGAPTGEFKSVSASDGHSCGVRIDNTIACWGYNLGGQSDAPT